MDEAKVNVDTKSDQIMQKVLPRDFKDCTMLTIGHCHGQRPHPGDGPRPDGRV
ncbi:hypothetical protein BX661DRAFT_211927 [Kickxella alabastrina]|uniref:uncharacterized protein n=1 Tax=Kickxella alabastrina TaxID=61397 RepID=UPI00221ECF3C|nr:uncharacterized protein BX661DRAFT_211927 [Kickxella alabastrina]KAI7818829.1 hypothetical protein BX661DRAFT_211927 [Kickxella alabastrina]